MITFSNRAIAETMITVTTTSTSLMSLVGTAASKTDIYDYYVKGLKANAIRINTEGGGIRYAFGAVPTSTSGLLLPAGGVYTLSNDQLDQLNLISTTGGNVSCSILFCKTSENETDGGIGGLVTSPVSKPSSSTYSPSQFSNLGANVTLNVKASAGNVFALSCHNLNASDRFIQLHNTATVPGGGATPVFTEKVPAGATIIIGEDFFSASGWNFSTGIAFAFSTTEITYTAAVAADQVTFVSYK